MTLSTLRLSNAALIVVEHERRLDVVGERRHLLLVEEVLEEGKDPLAGGRVGRDGEDDACAPPAPRRGTHAQSDRSHWKWSFSSGTAIFPLNFLER